MRLRRSCGRLYEVSQETCGIAPNFAVVSVKVRSCLGLQLESPMYVSNFLIQMIQLGFTVSMASFWDKEENFECWRLHPTTSNDT